MHQEFGQVCAVLGLQWGDEGKGKLTDILANDYEVIARGTGGANAGHTIYRGKEKIVFHLIPSGMMHGDTECVLGNGMVIHIPTFFQELAVLQGLGVNVEGRLWVSDRAHIVFDYHKKIDGILEELRGARKVGTTLRGIGPAYGDKIMRQGFRIGDCVHDFDAFSQRVREHAVFLGQRYGAEFEIDDELAELRDFAAQLRPMVIDSGVFFHDRIATGKTFLLEGANGALLDIDHGTYPYVTSSNATIGGVIAGTGISPFDLTSVIGVAKAYTTRVGAGAFPTELDNELGDRLRNTGGEFGATTGRPRRCGWFDAVIVGDAIRLNGVRALNLTKLDVLSGLDEVKIGIGYRVNGRELTHVPFNLATLNAPGELDVRYTSVKGWNEDISGVSTFEELPEACRTYIETLEQILDCPIRYIGVGPRPEQMITR